MTAEDLKERRACRMWHSWSVWSAPTEGRQKWLGGTWESCTIQERNCLDCNKQELRKV